MYRISVNAMEFLEVIVQLYIQLYALLTLTQKEASCCLHERDQD